MLRKIPGNSKCGSSSTYSLIVIGTKIGISHSTIVTLGDIGPLYVEVLARLGGLLLAIGIVERHFAVNNQVESSPCVRITFKSVLLTAAVFEVSITLRDSIDALILVQRYRGGTGDMFFEIAGLAPPVLVELETLGAIFIADFLHSPKLEVFVSSKHVAIVELDVVGVVDFREA